MTEHWTDRLSEYIDGDLEAPETAALEEHLALCAACRSTLAELRVVTDAAHSLEDRGPAIDLLPGIMQRIAAGDDDSVVPIATRSRSVRRFTFSMPQLAAAASVLITLSAGTVYMLTRPATPTPAATTVAESTDGSPAPAEMAAQFVTATEQNYQATIADLESVLASQRDQLDPATIAIIEQNLAVIDAAIEEARAALENDPSRAYLYRHFDTTMNKKVELLRRATNQRATAT